MENVFDDYSKAMHACNKKHADLQQKEATLQKGLHNFNNFLRRNNNKRLSAQEKIRSERQYQEKCKRDIEEKKQELRDYFLAKAKKEKEVLRFTKFKDFLHEAVEIDDRIGDVDQLMQRYDSVAGSYRSEDIRNSKLAAQLDKERQDLIEYESEMRLKILNASNQLSRVVKDADREEVELRKMEKHWELLRSTASEKSMVLGKISM